MSNALVGMKIAVLVANGFNEVQMTGFQRAFQKKGAHVRVISMDNGLVNGWTGEEWGHHYASDAVLNTALAVDYDLLLVPGGQRSVEKLKLTGHTKRFIGGFVNGEKPCAVLEDAASLLFFTGLAAGKTISAPEALSAEASLQEATYSAAPFTIEGSLMTTNMENDIENMIAAVCDHFETRVAAQAETQMAA